MGRDMTYSYLCTSHRLDRLLRMQKQSEPLVSIIVPVYNAEKYLRYCLDSIVAQSHLNLDIILVNDGSTDSSAAICDEYADADSRIRVIHQPNGGISKAQNAGLDAARGQYIAFSDNDDILDRNNIKYLLHALEKTGADMSKARWKQFGVSQLEQVAQDARTGAPTPDKVTVFTDPLRAYQTVFCKSLRILGNLLGKNTEAKYFNEANWCRLYRRELWDDIRFPEGMYAQDTAIADQLYAKMKIVADIDVSLYNWLQRPESVTHKMRTPEFHHDHIVAASTNFNLSLSQDLTPARSFYTLINNFKDENRGGLGKEQSHVLRQDEKLIKELTSKLSITQIIICHCKYVLRKLEKIAYDLSVKNMK